MLLAIDVGNSGIYACEGSCRAGIVELNKTAETQLPPLTVSDGMIRNQVSMAMALNKMLGLNDFRSKYSAVTFNSSRVLSRKLELPMSRPKELRKMVYHEMMQVVSESGEVAVEYSMVREQPVVNGRVGMWAYAMPKDIIDDYYSLYKSIRLKPIALDIHQNSIEKLFTDAEINGAAIGGHSVLFGDIGSSSMEIHLFSEGNRVFSRISPFSSPELEGLLNEMGYKRGSLLQTIDVSPSNLKENPRLADAAGRYFGRIADEFQKMIQFQLRRDSLNPVTEVYLYGEMSLIKSAADFLSSLLNINVRLIESVSKLKCPKNINITKFLNAAGALIRL